MNEQDLMIAIRADNAQLMTKLKEAQAELRKIKPAASEGMKGLVSDTSAAIAKMTFFTAAAAGAGTALYEVGKKASEIKKIESSFYALTASVNASGSAILGALEKASGGSVSQLEIMKSSSQAIKLMGEDVVTSLPKMMEIAVATAAATGGDVTQSFNDVITATGRQSVEILDNVGISAATTKKYIDEWATAHGKASDKLDDASKRAAFFYAVQKAGGEIVAAQGGSIDDMTSAWDRLAKSLSDSSDNLIKIANLFEPVADSMSKGFKDIGESGGFLSTILGGLAKYAALVMNAFTALARFSVKMYSPSTWGDIAKDFHANNLKILNDVEETQKRINAINQPRLETESSTYSKRKELADDYYNYVEERHRTILIEEMLGFQEVLRQQKELLDAKFINEQTWLERVAELKKEYNDREKEAEEEQEKREEEKEIKDAKKAEEDRKRKEELYLARAGFYSLEVTAARQMMDNLSTLMQAKDKRLFAIGKAAAYGRAVMNIAEGVTKALSYGPILGPALAATVVAAGAVQIANIKSQTYGGGGSSSTSSSTSAKETDSAASPSSTDTSTSKSINLYGKNLEQFAVGTWDVPSDMAAIIHKGEVITPKTFADSMRSGDTAMVTPKYMSQLASMIAQNSGGNTNVIVQGSVVDAQGLLDIVDTQRAKKARNLGTNDYQTKSVYV